MTNCSGSSFEFPPPKRLKIEADFSGGEVTGDGGLLLLRDVDRRIGLLDDVASRLDDPRDPLRVQHSFHQAIVDNFIVSFETAPKELILDFDATAASSARIPLSPLF